MGGCWKTALSFSPKRYASLFFTLLSFGQPLADVRRCSLTVVIACQCSHSSDTGRLSVFCAFDTGPLVEATATLGFHLQIRAWWGLHKSIGEGGGDGHGRWQ
ncbi:uncharacterized protein G2W53_042702 [Senna tora]|uniref:Uncharacterized protein n=1 Tax=Senna tora TaxID=362788 RepID=A0A834SHN0_9FABA|nr:uncharacterized protein G2W53_042702 [Senna tora]